MTRRHSAGDGGPSTGSQTPADAVRRPLPVIGLRQRRRGDGTPFLVAVVDERLVLEPGTELHLVRVAADHHAGAGCTHALRILPPHVAPTAAALRRAAADRLDGSGVRLDPRTSP